MGDYDPASSDLRRHMRKPLGDTLIRQAVETVPSYSFRIEVLRNCIAVGIRIVSAMKGGVETSYLGKAGRACKKSTDRREIVRLMEGRQ